MTRPRYPSSDNCATCALSRRVTPEQEHRVALHRLEHRRADHRWAQWRRQQAAAVQQETLWGAA